MGADGSEESSKFPFAQNSFDETKERNQNAEVAKLFQNLERLTDPKKATHGFIKNLTKQMNIPNVDHKQPNNPHWIMNKQLKMPTILDNYFRPTYYDVIYV